MQLRIMLVENHPDTLVGMVRYLESLGHIVRSATSVADGLRVLPEIAIDVLISDIGLPDGTGWDLLEQAALPPDVYTIAMTGFGMREDKARSERSGFRRHLVKPFDPDVLDEILAQAASEREHRIAG